jgi:hypothetical protein
MRPRIRTSERIELVITSDPSVELRPAEALACETMATALGVHVSALTDASRQAARESWIAARRARNDWIPADSPEVGAIGADADRVLVRPISASEVASIGPMDGRPTAEQARAAGRLGLVAWSSPGSPRTVDQAWDETPHPDQVALGLAILAVSFGVADPFGVRAFARSSTPPTSPTSTTSDAPEAT